MITQGKNWKKKSVFLFTD